VTSARATGLRAALVAALVAAGARILEVRADVPALEDVYLQLLRSCTGAEVAPSEDRQ
jgi:hypothetical protein